jgi:hypothetical protein
MNFVGFMLGVQPFQKFAKNNSPFVILASAPFFVPSVSFRSKKYFHFLYDCIPRAHGSLKFSVKVAG